MFMGGTIINFSPSLDSSPPDSGWQLSLVNPALIDFLEKHLSPGSEKGLGFIPSPHDFSYLKGLKPKAAEINFYPSSYDLRSLGKLSPVKDQGPYGTCWAFATYGSLESCLLPGELRDFSEDNMINLDGFDRGYNDGGNHDMATAYLARWSGPVNESDDPYSDHWSPQGLPPQKHVQEVLYLPPRSGPGDNDTIKWALMTYGGVGTSIYWGDSCYNPTYKSYYYSGTAAVNHGVVIVGWDDNYDKARFAGASGTPPGNGAFIVRNSWGSSWGDSGYFYVSYYDSRIGMANAVFNNAESVTNYGKIYQYDTLGWTTSGSFGSQTGWFAAVFQATSTETISAVAFYSAALNSSYEVYVQPSYTGSNLKGSLVASGTLSLLGFHTVSFAPQPIPPGNFSVAVKLTTPGYNYPIPMENPISGYSSTATANFGQTFVSSNGSSWTDLNSIQLKSSVCLKAYTQPSSQAQPSLSFTPTSFPFTCTQGAGNPPSQTLEVWNSGGGSMNWTTSKNASWLSLSPTSGNSSGEHDQITVSVNSSSLSSGTYSATITLTGEGASKSPQLIPVTLQIFPLLPSLQLLSPNGGEYWTIGNTRDNTWTSSNLTGNVKIELNRNYPSGSWEVLFASTPNDGAESWVVTGPVSSSCRIRISSVNDPSVWDVSDGNFSIEQAISTFTFHLQPKWNMFSLPVITDPNPLNVFSSLTGTWYLYQWDPINRIYLTKNQITLEPGEGYWLKVSTPQDLVVQGQPINQDLTLSLFPGWNLVGYPFLSPSSWSSPRILYNGTLYTLDQAAANQIITPYVYTWNGISYDNVKSIGSFQPGKGYWFKAKLNCELLFYKP